MAATVQIPVTGRETLQSSGDPRYALAEFYRAFNERDLALMQQNWDDSPAIVMDNPLGGIKRGWLEISAVYDRIFHGKARVEVEFYDYSTHLSGDIACFVGRERGTLSVGDTTLRVAIRTTRLFARRGNRWRQVHHHGSIEDPKLLQSYLDLVR